MQFTMFLIAPNSLRKFAMKWAWVCHQCAKLNARIYMSFWTPSCFAGCSAGAAHRHLRRIYVCMRKSVCCSHVRSLLRFCSVCAVHSSPRFPPLSPLRVGRGVRHMYSMWFARTCSCTITNIQILQIIVYYIHTHAQRNPFWYHITQMKRNTAQCVYLYQNKIGHNENAFTM